MQRNPEGGTECRRLSVRQFLETVERYLPASDIQFTGRSRTIKKRDRERSQTRGFAYGIHGSYDGYACGIMPGRARSGYLAHEEGFTGQTLWLYSPGKPMNFNGTEQLKFFPLLKYRGTDGRIVSTLQWEGLCEGIDDYAYMNTLDRLLARH